MESDKKVAASLPPPTPLAPPSLNGSNAFPRVRPMHGRTSGPARRSTRGQWTPEEDDVLRKAVQRFKGKNWKKIAECFKDRTDVQCLHRWQKVLNPELIKGPWSKEEDEIIVQLVAKYGPKKWSTIAQHLPGRIGKQCRERWHNHLNPSINKEAWTQEEELVLIRAHQIHGNRWAELTKYLPGRTDNAIKNHWNSSVKKKLDSYIASGLLAQFQGMPLVTHHMQAMPTASLSVQQSSGDGSVLKDGSTEAEQNSECSQVGCSSKEENLFSEESDHGKLQTSSPTAEDVTFTVPDIPYEFGCSSKFLEDKDSTFSTISLPNIPSMELAQDTSFQGNYYIVDPINDLVSGPSTHSIEYDAFASANNVTIISDVIEQNQKTEEGGSELITQNKGSDECPVNGPYCSDIIDMDRYRDYIKFQTTYQVSDTSGDIALPSNNTLDALGETSNCGNQINDNVALTETQKISNVGPTCDNQIDVGPTEQTEMKEPARLVPVYTFASETSGSHQITSDAIEKSVDATCGQEVGTLCYEPPRFPSLDIPFFSCDLAHSGNDVQQEFSPLGIRQLMMSSKLWDSPSSDDSPDALLKSAAKTFACTPSILKKRHRDLFSPLSPFSERRCDKKAGSHLKDGLTDCKEPSSPSPEGQREDKENISPALERQREDAQEHFVKIVREEDCVLETPKGVLVERHLYDAQISSSDKAEHKEGSNLGDGAIEACSSKNTSKQATILESLTCKAKSILSPPFVAQKKHINDSSVTSVMADSLVNEIGAENLNFFGGTPFRRSIESPSAWKSPWYFSSLVCPMFDTDLTVEDIGIFMSPGDRSFDAIGLMKQINEQSASAYADAREVLGSETPESILRQRCARNNKLENEKFVDSLMLDVPTERRVLDFSDCGSPAKPTEKGKGVITASLASPSSCLLKSYR